MDIGMALIIITIIAAVFTLGLFSLIKITGRLHNQKTQHQPETPEHEEISQSHPSLPELHGFESPHQSYSPPNGKGPEVETNKITRRKNKG